MKYVHVLNHVKFSIYSCNANVYFETKSRDGFFSTEEQVPNTERKRNMCPLFFRLFIIFISFELNVYFIYLFGSCGVHAFLVFFHYEMDYGAQVQMQFNEFP